jgi:hypothetical protein
MNANIHQLFKKYSNAKRLVLLVRSGFRCALYECASENCLVVGKANYQSVVCLAPVGATQKIESIFESK